VPSDAPGAVLDRVRAACAARGLTLPAAS
jgi:hypothetical protein